MARPKRTAEAESTEGAPSSKKRKEIAPTAAGSRSRRPPAAKDEPAVPKPTAAKKAAAKPTKKATATSESKNEKVGRRSKKESADVPELKKQLGRPRQAPKVISDEETPKANQARKITKKESERKAVGRPKKTTAKIPKSTRGESMKSMSVEVPAPNSTVESESEDNEKDEQAGVSYWLMKAEPESRIEKGKDVKFSIDDLAGKTEPEPWDGIRNLAARNNLRAMMKGDLAFFYHSNCKFPGVVGILEIVKEHSVDESAFDEQHPYFDAKSTKDSPKWFVVHVEYRQKFSKLISLKELQRFAKQGGILERLETLKQSRLSVSKVSKKEWDFILSLAPTNDSVPADTAGPSTEVKEGSTSAAIGNA